MRNIYWIICGRFIFLFIKSANEQAFRSLERLLLIFKKTARETS